jgi:hypothetical protein
MRVCVCDREFIVFCCVLFAWQSPSKPPAPASTASQNQSRSGEPAPLRSLMLTTQCTLLTHVSLFDLVNSNEDVVCMCCVVLQTATQRPTHSAMER